MTTIRVLAFLEASTITGPAKNLLQFARLALLYPDPRVEVSIANFRREGDSNVFLDAARAANIEVHTLPERGAFDRSVLGSMKALVDKLKPDILQTHAVKSHFLMRSTGMNRRIPWVAFHHGYTWPTFRARVYNELDRWSLREPRRVVTVSLPFKKELVSKGVRENRIFVLHNAIDTNWTAEAQASAPRLRAQMAIDAATKAVLIVGRLSREKDHLTLVDAIHDIQGRGRVRPHLVIVGEGPERATIDARIREYGMESSVTLTGQVVSAYPYYGLADVAVLSSLSEGSPNALLEAMAAGVPAVATTVGGIPEIVTDRESALLVAPRDRRAMAAAIESVLTQEELATALKTRALELVKSRHSPEVRVRTLSRLYEETMKQ